MEKVRAERNWEAAVHTKPAEGEFASDIEQQAGFSGQQEGRCYDWAQPIQKQYQHKKDGFAVYVELAPWGSCRHGARSDREGTGTHRRG